MTLIYGFDPSKSTGYSVFSPEPRAGRCQRFLDQVVMPYDGEECIKWPFARGGKGYGYMRVNGVHQVVHRYICKLANGEPPSEIHEASHTCGNGFEGCVSKRHLLWKTPKENAADKIIHGTVNNGERNGASKLNRQQVLQIYGLKGKQSQRAVADQYGISGAQVRLIQLGKKWGWLTQGILQ